MKVTIQVTVSSDDDTVSKTASSSLMLASGIDGMDPAEAKQDFLMQVDSLVRTIADNQIPALYQSVAAWLAAGPEDGPDDEPEDEPEAVGKLRKKRRTVRARKKGAQEEPEQPEQNSADPVEDGVPYGPFAEEDGQ